MNILLVEDETRVADFIQRGLKAEGWLVTVAPDGETAIELARGGRFSVIILDLMLPGISGQDVCRRLRARGEHTPILMLTALDSVEERVAGLNMGADDYLAKPFSFDELLARIGALARRVREIDEDRDGQVLSDGPLRFDIPALRVTCHDEVIELTAKERDILQLLLTNQGRVLSRERILSTVWNLHADPQTNIVDVYIGRLRKRLGRCGECIQTIRGTGYSYRSAGSD